MQSNIRKKAEAFQKQGTTRKLWQRIVSGLTCIVVFCTTYALILPAITMEGDSLCGIAEHTHTQECYADTGMNFLCDPVHSHGDTCYGSDGTLVCGQADFVLHTHNEICYSEDGGLICTLPENQGHTHTDICYTQILPQGGHVHGDECYTLQQGALVCQTPESEGHTHGTDCYGEKILICGTEESTGHSHNTGCYGEAALSCGQEEGETHTHTDTCYTQPLICGQEEYQGHTHGEACWETPLVCTTAESEGHTHTDGCYEWTTTLVCGQEEAKAESVLTCTEVTNAATHIHTESCLPEPELLCEEEEHTHTLICYSDPNADVEYAYQWEKAFENLDMDGTTAEDLLAVAKTQLGYTESKRNYAVLDDGITIKGYTRYGAWAGTPYADWSELFVEFCLHYAGIGNKDFPRSTSEKTWIRVLNEAGLYYNTAGTPVPGDLIFLKIEDVEYVGIVSKVSDGYVTAILGDYKDEVRSETFTLNDEDIVGYAALPELEEAEQPTETTETVTADLAMVPMLLSLDDGLDTADDDTTGTDTGMTSTGDIRLDQYIKSISVYHTYQYYEDWKELKPGESVQADELVRFYINYIIPGNVLSSDNKQVVYQLPVTSISEAVIGKPVYNDGGEQVGTFDIDTNGLLTITFFDAYVTENAKGTSISGKVYFDSLASALDTDNDGMIELEFKDNEEVYVNIYEEIKDDLEVAKTKSDPDEDGYYTFTVTVRSKNGTATDVSFTDTMSNLIYVDGFTIKDASGNDVTSEYAAPEVGANKIELTFPKMDEGSLYTITYRCKINEFSGTTIKGGNSATVTSQNEDGDGLKDSASVTIEFENEMLKKTGAVNEDGKTATWTITVGTDDQDLSGWTLSDVVNGMALQSDVNISFTTVSKTTGEDGSETTVETATEVTHKLPYTFPEGAVGTATVTYTTNIEYGLGGQNMSNTATLTPPNGSNYPTYSEGETVVRPDDWQASNPLSKDAKSITANAERTSAVINWSLTINAEKDTIYADITYDENGNVVCNNGWYFMDILDNGQTISDDQWSKLEEEVASELKTVFAWASEDTTGLFKIERAVVDYKNGFKVTVYQNLPAGQSFAIDYESTAPLGDGTSEKTFTNNANINNKVSAWDSAKYYPVVIKTDASNDSVSDSSHPLANLNNNTVSWKIKLWIPAEYANGTVKVVEDLPDQLDLSGLSMNVAGTTYDFVLAEDGTVSVTVGTYSITSTIDDATNTLTLILPQEFAAAYKEQSITFEIAAKLPDGYTIEGDPTAVNGKVDLTNTVTIKAGDGDSETDIGSDSQKQTITNEDTVQKIEKVYGEIKNNIVPYTIEINKERADLLDGSDTLTVKDVLTFNNTPSQGYVFTVTLVPNSVKVYTVDDTGNKEDITTSITYTYQEEVKDKYGNGHTTEYTYTLELQVPDEEHIVIEYQYIVNGEVGDTKYAVLQNSASLTEVGGKNSTSSQVSYKIQVSEATANLEGIVVLKVDSENQAQLLKGATYELYKYDSTTKEWHFAQDASSDANGKLELELNPNQAYYLIETQAPSGYILDQTRHYFLIYNKNKIDDETYPLIAPSDFPTTAYMANGSTLRFTNTKLGTSLKVNKLWADADGNTINAPDNASIGVNLMQVWNRYPSDFDTSKLGQSAKVNVIFGGYSYQSDVGTQTVDAQVGDIMTITLRTKHIPLEGQTTADPAGLMEITSTANNHVKYTVVQDGEYYVYTFTYLVTGDAELHGWVYPPNVNDSSFTAQVTTGYSSVELSKDPVIYESLTLSETNNWESSFTNLPQYELSSTGQVTGYYTYYAQETSKHADYRVTYTGAYSKETAVDSGTVTITNVQKKPDVTKIDVTKEWVNSSGQIISAPEGVDHVQFMLYQVYTDKATGLKFDSGNPDANSSSLATLEGEVTFSNGSWKFDKTANLLAGTKVTLKFTYNNDLYGADIGTKIGNINVNENPQTPTTKEKTITYEFALQPGNNEINGTMTGTQNEWWHDWEIEIDYGAAVETGDAGIYGPYNIWAGNNWTWESSDVAAFADGLPLEKLDDNSNVVGTYSYYVKEISTGDYKLRSVSHGNADNTATSDTITITNTYDEPDKETTEITVNKVWLTKTGEEITNMTNIQSIQFYLKRSINDGEPERVDNPDVTVEEIDPYEVKKADNWTKTITGLPLKDSDGNTYTYSVEEIPVDGYNSSANQNEDGSWTITNQVVETAYELPETGGTGTMMYTLGGLAMCGWACLQYNHKKRRKEARTS